MKTEQEIIEILNKRYIYANDSIKSGFIDGYTQAQTDMQTEVDLAFNKGCEKMNSKLKPKIDALKAKITAKDVEIEKLKAELQEAKNDAMLDNTIIENLKKEIWTIKSQLLQKIASIQDDYNSMDDKCALLEKAQTDMQSELQARDKEIERLKIGIKVASGVLLDKRAEAIQLKSELQEAETHLLNFVDWIEKEISIFDERPKKELY